MVPATAEVAEYHGGVVNLSTGRAGYIHARREMHPRLQNTQLDHGADRAVAKLGEDSRRRVAAHGVLVCEKEKQSMIGTYKQKAYLPVTMAPTLLRSWMRCREAFQQTK